MSKNTLSMGLMLVALISLSPVGALAHSAKRGGHGPWACKADVEKYCAGVEKGKGRILACLQANQTSLTPDCQAKLPLMEKFHEMKLACRADREKLCAQAEGGRKGVRQCMKQNRDLLSPECQNAMEEVKTLRCSNPS